MQKPNDYDNTQASGDFTPAALGGHYLVIKKVEETKSKTGKDMIVIYFDFDINDKQPKYFENLFRDDIRPDKKWNNAGIQRTLVYDNEGKTSRNFKTFCTCVEHSNKGFTVSWGDNWGEQFKNKKVGGVFGIEMDFYDDKAVEKHVLRWFVSSDKVEQAKIPEPTETKSYKANKNSIPDADGFVNVPDGIDEELPFN